MQRAANASSPSSPASTSGPPSKKPRLSNGSSHPSSQTSTPIKHESGSQSSDRQAVQAALEEQERIRQQALDRAAADAGEVKWVLSFQEEPKNITENMHNKGKRLRVVKKSYAEIDWGSENIGSYKGSRENKDDIDQNKDRTETDLGEKADENDSSNIFSDMAGRRSFGRFNKSIERHRDPNYESSSVSSNSVVASDSASESSQDIDSEEEGEDVDPTEYLIRSTAAKRARAEAKAIKKAAKGTLLKEVEDRRNIPVDLKGLSGISTGGGADPRKGPGNECFKCGNKGHKARNCPNSNGLNRASHKGAGKHRRADF